MRLLHALLALALLAGPAVHAEEWGDLALISSTLGVSGNRICIGESTRGEIGCPTYAPYVNPTTGHVGIGTESPSGTLHLFSSGIGNLFISGISNTSRLAAHSDGILWIQSGTSADTSNAPIAFSGMYGAGGVRMYLDTDGKVGIGTRTPSTTLHLSGTLRIANGGESCDANRAGGIRYNSGTFEFCDGGGTWESMATVAGGEGGTSDRIVSGTTSLVAGEDGSLKLTASGTSKMIYSAGGSLGLGTDAPQGGTFHINGANGTANAAINLSISGTTTTQMSAIQFVTKSGNTPRLGQSDTNGWSLSARGDGLSIPQQQNDLIFYSYAGVTPKLVMAMDSVSQSVGIGTDDPEATLDVSGTVKVAGTGSEGCDPSKWGMLRRNPATGKLQICRH